MTVLTILCLVNEVGHDLRSNYQAIELDLTMELLVMVFLRNVEVTMMRLISTRSMNLRRDCCISQ